MSSLMLGMSITILGTGKDVVLDSGFCAANSITNI